MSLVEWVTVSSAIILAIAGVMALIVQRSRYLRDTVPVLRIVGAETTQVAFLNHLVTCELRIGVHDDSNQIVLVDRPHVLRAITGPSESTAFEHASLMTRMFDTNLKLYAGDSGSSETFEDWEVPFDQPEVDPIVVKIAVLISWKTEFDFLTSILLPLSRGRRQFDRIVELSATYVAAPHSVDRFESDGFVVANVADEFTQSYLRNAPSRLGW